MVTFDGLHYDLQAAGEFETATAEAFGMYLQARLVPQGNSTSYLKAIAFDLQGHAVELGSSGLATYLFVDGSTFDLSPGSMLDFGNGAELLHLSDGYYAVWPGQGSRPALWYGDRQVRVYMPPFTHVSGLLGNADGNPTNDLETGFGTMLPANADQPTINGSFAESWRITQDESLFTYAQGESTDSFTDRSFPSSPVSINSLSDVQLTEASRECSDAGVADGVQFEDCILDWALTQDEGFLSAVAHQVGFPVEGNAQTVDQTGVISEDFDNEVASNFSSPRYAAGPENGTFAGPLGESSRYVFYVPDLPGHFSATVQFDLVAVGDWATNASQNTVTLTIDGVTAWSEAVALGTPSSTGTLPSGQNYAVYPVSVTIPHTAQRLNAGISALIPANSSRTFGVDNIHVSLALVPPQVFDIGLGVAISDGVPNAGAGNLETTGSEDDYRLNTQAGDLQLDFSACSSSLSYYVTWKLLAQTGELLAVGGGCWGTLIPNVPAGDLRLVVSHPGAVGTYNMIAYSVPAPQTFNLTLPATVSPGVPMSGAGNLETTASADQYAFSTVAQGNVQVDFSSCASSLGFNVDWKVIDGDSGATFYSATGCGSTLVPNLPAGQYRLVVTRNGHTGSYSVGIGLQPSPQFFILSLPASISNGNPAVGAGNLETSSSQDNYRFTTTSTGGVQIDFSNCASTLAYNVSWNLMNEATGSSVYSTTGCSSKLVADVPSGQYRLVVTRSGMTGTYNVGVLVQPPPQVFNVSLPATISDGVPAAGAGNLETTASQDEYAFATASVGGVQVDLSNCSSSLSFNVFWKLVNSQTGATVYSTTGCSSKLVSNVSTGQYRIVVTRNGMTGTYNLGILVQPPPQVFNVSLPATISNGVPAAGAGNLETTASQDEYAFSTAASGTLQAAFSNCSSGLAFNVDWKLLNSQTGATIFSTTGCTTKTFPSLAAGQYRVVVTRNGRSGSYMLTLSSS